MPRAREEGEKAHEGGEDDQEKETDKSPLHKKRRLRSNTAAEELQQLEAHGRGVRAIPLARPQEEGEHQAVLKAAVRGGARSHCQIMLGTSVLGGALRRARSASPRPPQPRSEDGANVLEEQHLKELREVMCIGQPEDRANLEWWRDYDQ